MAYAILCAVRWLVLALLATACGSPDVPDRLFVRFDAGDDAIASAGGVEDAAAEASPYLGGPCVDDAQCDDMIACTYDSCDQTSSRCLNIPDDSQCDDGIYCDGKEQCVVGHGCEPGPVVTCSDGTACDISTCVEATKSCTHVPRDEDQDGDPDGHCPGGHDCNDLDPNVSSLHAEVCNNHIDDNCNGLIDEMPCVVPQGDTCADAVVTGGAGTYGLSTVGCDKTFSTSCSVTNPSAGQDVVAAVTVPPGPAVDLEVWATTNGVEVSIALQGACGEPATELGCGSGQGATSVRALASNVAPGTYYAVVTTQSPTTLELKVELLAAGPPATNVDCASAIGIDAATPEAVSTNDAPPALASGCDAGTGERTYSFTLAQPQDVRVYGSTVQGSGSPILGLRDSTCTNAADEISCRNASLGPVFARALSPGSYVVTVAATSPIDESVLVELSPPSTAPPDQTCASPPPIAANATVSFDLSDHDDAIKDGCLPGGPNAAYDVMLPVASDVLLVERLPETDNGAVSLDPPDCSSSVACFSGATVPDGPHTPLWIGQRNVAPGDYRAVVTDELGLQGTLDALVRPTVAPTIVPPGGADTCATAIDASAGGFFVGDTSTTQANYTNACNAPTSPPAPDQVLALNLTQAARVVLDMEGSTYTTVLDIHQGPSCPGTPVTGGCYVGFGPQRSFLDMSLQPGMYWIIVSGYDEVDGPWNLDVRVLPP
jgi:hypothetical protein